jgi:DNA-binding NarL/FixJ family response regulator
MIKVLIADDHQLMREGLRQILKDGTDIDVIGEATNAAEVLAHPRLAEAGVILCDLSMPGCCGIEMIARIRVRAPGLGMLVLTMHDEGLYAVRAIRAGAHGYLTKENSVNEVVAAIRTVACGRLFISPKVSEQLALELVSPAEAMLPHARLSKRELQIFSMLVAGSSVSGAAAALEVSVKTVSTYKTRILQKMGLHDLPHMVLYAMAHGLLSPAQPRRDGRARPSGRDRPAV